MVDPRRVDKARDGFGKAMGGIGDFAQSTSKLLGEQARDLRNATTGTTEKLTAKKPDPYDEAIAEYNGAFTALHDKGVSLLRQRERSTDLIQLVELLVNSIANTPKSFDTDFDEIDVHKARFLDAEEFARQDLDAARKSAGGAGAGLAAGAAIANLAPSAAIWVATTFGAASTGTAISTLSGAAASNAALAWLGGGALAAGGGGTVGGSALLALAGPIGWTVAGASLLTSIALFSKKSLENRESKQEELTAVKENTALVDRLDVQVDDLLQRTAALRERLMTSYSESLELFGGDYRAMSAAQQTELAALVNNTKACAALLSTRIEQDTEDE